MQLPGPALEGKVGWRLVLSLLPGLWAISTTPSGTLVQVQALDNSAPLAVVTPGSTSSWVSFTSCAFRWVGGYGDHDHRIALVVRVSGRHWIVSPPPGSLTAFFPSAVSV